MFTEKLERASKVATWDLNPALMTQLFVVLWGRDFCFLKLYIHERTPMLERNCAVCQIPTKVVETIEGGGDTVERHVCTNCGAESYVGRFTFRAPPAITNSSGSKGKYFCSACGFGTDCGECPCCGQSLVQSGSRRPMAPATGSRQRKDNGNEIV